jgi:hypothetical protein
VCSPKLCLLDLSDEDENAASEAELRLHLAWPEATHDLVDNVLEAIEARRSNGTGLDNASFYPVSIRLVPRMHV